MPFDFAEYDYKCSQMSPEQLQREWNHYTRLITGSATSTALSGLALLPTLGVSMIGIAIGSSGIHNARKKRDIIDRHLARYGQEHKTRMRDVAGSMVFSGTVGVVTLGVGMGGAETVLAEGIQHGLLTAADETVVKVGTHAVADGVALSLEHKHHEHIRAKEEKRA